MRLSDPLATDESAPASGPDRPRGPGGLRRLLPSRRDSDVLPVAEDDEPLRGELYSGDQLAQHARTLAGWHEVAAGRAGSETLLDRLEDNGRVLRSAFEQVVRAAEKGRRLAPAAEWVVDNFYLIEQQLRLASRHLPTGYSKELPRLTTGPNAGRPRVYDLALELIRHVDGQVDEHALDRFVESYARAAAGSSGREPAGIGSEGGGRQALRLGELWAVPIMLRIALIENLRRVAARVAAGQADQDLADAWSSRILKEGRRDPKGVVRVLADLYETLERRSSDADDADARAEVRLSSAFVSEFARRLQGQGPSTAFPLEWLGQALGEQGSSVEAMTQVESQRQAADQLSIGNSIGSLRFIAGHDWSAWVEAHSEVEDVLTQDPAGTYARQTFATRDRYRHAVERLARRSPHAERQVAERALQQARSGPQDDVASHIGHWLVGDGRPQLERLTGTRLATRTRLLFVAGVTLLTLIATTLILWWSGRTGFAWWGLLLLALPVLVVASQPAVGLMNWLVTLLASPKPLPRMDYRESGIPPESRTAVAVPVMFNSSKQVDDLVAAMEVRYLANRDANLLFALLSDLSDAEDEENEGDAELVAYAASAIRELNDRHGFGEGEKFLLFHRPRLWNESEGVWMGWERKRGKLAQFNALLAPAAGDGDPALAKFSTAVARRDLLFGVEYVIVLDSDTDLPRDAARQLVGTMDHPLNRPVYDAECGRVVRGYGILQPRVGVDLPSANASWFSRAMSGEPGVDPYTSAVSDVYQDAFGEGSFIGKGIYHAATFERACAGKFPENRILSHDLIESAFVRSGLVGDVVLYEDHPSSYLADVRRRHRWMRGDWQIADYVLPFGEGGRDGCRVSPLSRWKLFDNLRRSLVPPALLVTLIAAWFLAPSSAWAWSLLALGYFFTPPLLGFLTNAVQQLFARGEDRPLSSRLNDGVGPMLQGLARGLMSLAFLPFEAYSSLDAIVRTLYRRLVSHKHLLEWQTAADAERKARKDHASFWETMWPAFLIAAGAGGWLLGASAETSFAATMPLLVAWTLSPTLAFLVSRPTRRKPIGEQLARRDRRFLRKVARRTLGFFDAYVTAVDHHLPPDNVQEVPEERVAPRTSPTNIGLGLLVNLAGHDFGHLTLGQVLDRTNKTLATTARLERHASGHYYNWYDTRRLEPLRPRYVSSVDSGNFVACLHILEEGLRELPNQPAIGRQVWPGAADVIRLLLDTCRGREKVSLREGEPVSQKFRLSGDLPRRLEQLASECDDGGPRKLSGAKLLLQRLGVAAADAVAATRDAPAETRRWAHEFERQVGRFAEELHHLCPWVDLVGPARPFQGTDAASRQRVRVVEDALVRLDENPTLRDVAALAEEVVPAAEALRGEVSAATIRPHADLPYFERLVRILSDAATRSADRIATLHELADRCPPLRKADWSIVYDRSRHMLRVGYNVEDRRADAGHYDLLASEMRLGSLALVADGTLPQEHWFATGRQLTKGGTHAALLSWSGSMFEYLMPLLVTPTYDGTLLDETYRGVVARQIEYARTNGIKPGVPWGVSESGYAATDADLTYQYRPFGVPGLGFKRGLGEDLVIAPYASMMAVMVDPSAAAANLRTLRDEGRMGRHGFFEAVDYTPARVKRGQDDVTVRQCMAHHQAMGLLGLAYTLLDQPMQKRMMRSPAFRSAELLLHERVPKAQPVFPHQGEHAGSRRVVQEAAGTLRSFRTPHTPTPEVHLLGNGRLASVVTAAGGGRMRWDTGDGKTLAVTRWQEDATRDCWGTFCYLRDADTGDFWSSAYQPTLRQADRYEAIFSQARAEYRRTDRLAEAAPDESGNNGSPRDTGGTGEIETYTQVSVSPEDDVEIRRIYVTNHGRRARNIEVTSYAEAVLAEPAADAAHPAFQNLFVQTRLVRGRGAILAKRRARSAGERTPYLVHLVTCYGSEVGTPSYETDRNAFIGRGRSLVDPAAMHADRLGDSAGSVLDPVVSVRRTVRLEPGEKARFDVVTGVADNSEAAHALIERYHDRRLCDRVDELAWTHSQVVLRQLGIDEADAQHFGRLAGSVIYATPQRRSTPEQIARNATFDRKQSHLWAYGISGDLPIVLVRVADIAKVRLVEDAVRAHSYWRRKGLSCDLVVWNEDTTGYRAEVHDEILAAVGKAGEQQMLDKPGGIFVRRGEQFGEEDRVLLQAAARVVLDDKAGSIADQLDRRMSIEPSGIGRLVPQPQRGGLLGSVRREASLASEVPVRDDLLFYNGTGGFTADGKEYLSNHDATKPTPAPWSNVLANENFGTLVTEAGGGYTWRGNAREFRLTPFYNDPVSDASGEAMYLRDEETGRFWSPTGLPARGAEPYTTRHGFGYSVYEYSEAGLASAVTCFVHRTEPVKFWSVRVQNQTDRRRRVSLWSYNELVLADQRPSAAMHVVSRVDAKSGAVLARNPYNGEFGRETFFLQCSEAKRTVTGDRLEFLGRNGTPRDPAALGRTGLSGRVGAGLDPCAAMRVPLELGPGEEREVVFCLGAGDDAAHAEALAERFGSVAESRRGLEENWGYWGRTLGTLYIETPDPAVNALCNGWLEYQSLACRYWGRSGYYQSGGAYGFRDQLQDVAALLWCDPSLIREHLLRSAENQFAEGDVLHWWHPPSGKGVRTHFSDDYMWLPLIAARYVAATGDTGVLDEERPFLEGPPVPAEQESLYQEWQHGPGNAGSLYEHCRRAILNGVERRGYGVHGLPLIGCGDWNDGMNLIGEHGRGESVWLAWFFIQTLLDFAPIAEARGDTDFATRCRDEAEKLRVNVEREAWDGQWYRRAYFDDGTPLGSHQNPECQIDSLPQSWAVLCGRGDPERAAQGLAAVDDRLVRRDKGLIQLFDPPFDDSHLEPGYIKGYVPGVRENGGQYTHAAVWTVMAFAEKGEANKAWELFDLINPINHATDPASTARYRVEPYVVAADVYGVEPHVGRGGWTWYTGSAGWMFRLAVESLLGLKLRFEEGEPRLYVKPVLPDGWDGFSFTYRHRNTHHAVRLTRGGPPGVAVDGKATKTPFIRLLEDGEPHEVVVTVA